MKKEKEYNYKVVFVAACLGMLLFGVVMISLGSLLPSISKKIYLSSVETGATLSLLPLGILLGSIVFGPLVDRFGYKIILIIGGLLSFIGFEGLGVATQPDYLNWTILIIGLGGGILNGATNALVSDISKDKHSANLSLLGVFYGVGALGVPAVVGFLQKYLEIDVLIFWMGMGMLLPVVLFGITTFPSPKKAQGFPVAQGLGMLKDPILLLLGFVLFFQSGLEGIANNWTTLFLETERAFEPADALFVLSLFVGGLCAARLLLGKILRQINPYTVLLFSICILLGSATLIWAFQAHFLSIMGLLGFGIGLAAGFPVILGYVGKMYKELTGTAFSLVITIALIGNVLSNYLMGWVSQYFGIGLYPVLLVVLVIAMAGLILGLQKRLNQIKY